MRTGLQPDGREAQGAGGGVDVQGQRLDLPAVLLCRGGGDSARVGVETGGKDAVREVPDLFKGQSNNGVAVLLVRVLDRRGVR